MEIVPTKFVAPLTTHLICSQCNRLFSNPVINVHCGHTFCKECALSHREGNHTKCPIDSVQCADTSLVLNRALVNQIEDLKIYCRFSLVWSAAIKEYIIKSDGCQELLTLGKRNLHEDICGYAPVRCPNGNGLCAEVQRKDLENHLKICKNKQCPHHEKGCDFKDTEENVKEHTEICGFRNLQVVPGNVNQIKNIEKKNEWLETQVYKLTHRVNTLESEKSTLESKLEQCLRSIAQLDAKYSSMSREIEKNKLVRRTSSTISSRSKSGLGTTVNRTPSQTSLSSNYSISQGTSSKPESWTMPFQFKCIGTLRGHADIVWYLCTHESLLYSCGDDKCIKVWDLEALEKGCKKTIKAHEDKVHTLCVGQQFLFSGGGNGCVNVWNLQDVSLHRSIEDAHDNIVAAMVCTDEYLFSSSHTVIKVWDIVTLEHIHTIQGLHHWVRSLALSRTKEWIYSGSHNTIDIWETGGNFSLKGKITHTHGSVHSLAVTDTYIIAGTYNNNIHIFQQSDHTYVQKLSGHIGTVTSIAASKSGRFLFTASSDNTITLWNLENMLPIHSLNRHEGSVNSVVLYNDLLLSASEDTEIKVFKYSKMQPGFIPA